MRVNLTAFVLTMSLFQACDKPPRPTNSDALHGTWHCPQLPSEFLNEAGVASDTISEIILFEDGRYIAKKLPQSRPFRLVNIEGTWKQADKNATPSGKTSVRLDQGTFLIIVNEGDRVFLLLRLDVNRDLNAEYVRLQ